MMTSPRIGAPGGFFHAHPPGLTFTEPARSWIVYSLIGMGPGPDPGLVGPGPGPVSRPPWRWLRTPQRKLYILVMLLRHIEKNLDQEREKMEIDVKELNELGIPLIIMSSNISEPTDFRYLGNSYISMNEFDSVGHAIEYIEENRIQTPERKYIIVFSVELRPDDLRITVFDNPGHPDLPFKDQ